MKESWKKPREEERYEVTLSMIADKYFVVVIKRFFPPNAMIWRGLQAMHIIFERAMNFSLRNRRTSYLCLNFTAFCSGKALRSLSSTKYEGRKLLVGLIHILTL